MSPNPPSNFFDEQRRKEEAEERKIDEGFLEGYKNGLTWPDAWEKHGNPGGPWVSAGDLVSSKVNSAWKRGWRLGHAHKLERGISNPLRSS